MFSLFVLPAFTQQKPPAPIPPAPAAASTAPDPNAIPLSSDDKLKVSQMLGELKDWTIKAYQAKSTLDEANSQIQSRSADINKELDALRVSYHLPKDAFFQQDKLQFTKPPEKK